MITEIHQLFKENLEEYTKFRQNNLMRESNVLRFAKERGIPISKEDLKRSFESDWITRDSEGNLFHPFRIYPFIFASHLRALKITDKESSAYHCSEINKVKWANQISNLAILLEPLYWPKIVGKKKNQSSIFLTWDEFDEGLKSYKQKILTYVKFLSPEIWSNYYDSLRTDSAALDNNGELYILLRLSPWEKRTTVTGNIGGALWLRHIAEVVRLAFEEVHGVQWSEEHEVNLRREGLNTRLYGSERPIENGLITRPHLAFEFGLHTGSTVRWYVEGETEYQAALYALPNASLGGIEIINLKGVFKEQQKNMLRFEENLNQDKLLRRFVFISVDNDVKANLKFLRGQIAKENIVGYINVNDPDFEFENFTLNELIKIAIILDEKQGLSIDNLKSGNYQNIKSGKGFDDYYKKNSITKRSLKGLQWGEALAEYAIENPLKEDTQQRRTFLEAVEKILYASKVRYDYQKENFLIDPDDFQIKEKK